MRTMVMTISTLVMLVAVIPGIADDGGDDVDDDGMRFHQIIQHVFCCSLHSLHLKTRI